MKLRDLQFIYAFADVYNMLNRPFNEVYSFICEYFIDFSTVTDQYQDEFLEHYNAMKEYHLEDEVKRMIYCGFTFESACEEWDI